MGWLYTNKSRQQTVMDFFKKELGYDREDKSGEVLDCAVVNLRTAYLAYRVTNKETGRTFVIGAVCLIHFCKGYHNFGYKDMDETMGPYVARCPERILRQLSPLDQIEPHYGSSYHNARKWRKACRDAIARRKEVSALKVGDTIRFFTPVRFTDGSEVDTLRLLQKGKGRAAMVFESVDGVRRFRIGQGQMVERPFTVFQGA